MWPAAVLLLGLASAATLEDAVRQVFRSERYQEVLPASPAPPRESRRSPSEPGAVREQPSAPGAESHTSRPQAPSAGLGRAPWLLCLVAVVVVVTVAMLRRRRAVAGAPPDPARREPARGATPVTQDRQAPDRLAAEGRYGEAIHALLLLVLVQLSRGSSLAPALTGRELLASTALGARRREALEPLVRESERVHFAGLPASAEDYGRCRAHARQLLGGGA